MAGNGEKGPVEGAFPNDEVDGLILRKVAAEADGDFVRMGSFSIGMDSTVPFMEVLVSRLELQPGVSPADRFNVDDPRLADLVHTVNII